MGLGHERLDVYCLAIEYVAWVYGKAETLRGIHRPARDQQESWECKIELDRIAAMLSRLAGRGYCVKGDSAPYRAAETDFDPDSDFDPDEIKSQQADALDAHSSRQ